MQTFDVDGWSVELSLHSGLAVGPGESIAAANLPFRWIGPAQEIRGALDAKSRRYGRLAAPYLIVVADQTEELGWHSEQVHDAITESVLGDEVIEDRVYSSGETQSRLVRKGGFWFQNGKPRNRHVSGVLVLPDAGLWRLREANWQPVLALNPWAEYSLDEALLPLPRFTVRDDRWTLVAGTSAADMLGIPNPWPPEPPEA